MKGVVATCPATKKPIRLMPGSEALELYKDRKSSNKADAAYKRHMKQLELNYQKEIGNVASN